MSPSSPGMSLYKPDARMAGQIKDNRDDLNPSTVMLKNRFGSQKPVDPTTPMSGTNTELLPGTSCQPTPHIINTAIGGDFSKAAQFVQPSKLQEPD